jgi:23S rRNA (uracil1939-C5)-methyltransferase
MFERGEKLKVKVEKLAFQGFGIAKPENFTIFIPRTAPGDEAEIEITDRQKNFAHAMPKQITTPSSHRTEPPCPYFVKCGGCNYQHIQPDFVRTQKMEQLKETFERIGPGSIELRPIIEGNNKWNYRNRQIYRRDDRGHQGYVAWDNFETIDIDTCMIAEKELDVAWKMLKDKIAHISSKVLPFVTLRKIGSNICVIFACTKDFSTKELQDFFRDRPSNYHFYTTEVEQNSKVALGEKIEGIFAEPMYLEESIGETFYILRPDLFFQTNHEVASLMVNYIQKEMDAEKDPILDIYCGSGLFSLALSRLGIPTLGIEVEQPAITSAKQGALRNNVESITEYKVGKAEQVMQKLIKDERTFRRAIVDPPRKGLHHLLLQNIPKIGIDELYYVSCSPPTLARDLKELHKMGYKTQWCQPFEMFPQTYHIETVTKLVKVSG